MIRNITNAAEIPQFNRVGMLDLTMVNKKFRITKVVERVLTWNLTGKALNMVPPKSGRSEHSSPAISISV